MVFAKRNLRSDRKGIGENASKNATRVDFSCPVDVVSNVKSTRRVKALQALVSRVLKLRSDVQPVPRLHGACLGKCTSKSKAAKCGPSNFDWMQTIRDCPIYHPSMEEFEDPLEYLQRISPEASKYGICKVIPPLTSSTPGGVVLMKERRGFKFTTNIQPLRLAEQDNDDKFTFYRRGRYYTLRDFEKVANKAMARRYCISGSQPSQFLEKEFWNELINRKKRTVEYGVDVEGSAFSCTSDDPLAGSKWNLKTLPKLPGSTLRLLEDGIPGVTEPMLYIGMLFSWFAWHVEDHYLYSINYHHCGAHKTWYGVPGHAAQAFEEVAQHYIYNQEIVSKSRLAGVSDFLSQRTTMFPPKILLEHDVPVYRAVQMPGEFIVTFPRAYHAGFSHGFSCGEAVNFAIGDWFSFGAEATQLYALIGKMPVIPYEELLCKEAIHLSRSSSHEYHSAESPSQQCVKSSFAFLLRMYHLALWSLTNLKELLNFHPKYEGTIYCTLCKRDCYVAHITCQCYTDPICLFHESEIYSCSCGSNSKLFLREDIQEMEDLAKMFEQEEAIHHEVERKMKCNVDIWMQNLLSCVEKEYVPYCEVMSVRNDLHGDMSSRGSKIKHQSSVRVKKRTLEATTPSFSRKKGKSR